MKPSSTFHQIISGVIFIIFIIFSGCNSDHFNWGSKETGIILQYRLQEGKNIKYEDIENFTQDLTSGDRGFQLSSHQYKILTIEPKKTNLDLITLVITVDTIAQFIRSPRGEVNADVSRITGNKFAMNLSGSGREFNYSGAESLQYYLNQREKRNIAGSFQTIFPDLPEQPVKTGDTWKTYDTITEKGDGGILQSVIEYQNTLEGFETLLGFECAKITATYTGILKGAGTYQDVQSLMKGTINGQDTIFFDFKKGVLVKHILSGTVKSTTTTSGEKESVIRATKVTRRETGIIR